MNKKNDLMPDPNRIFEVADSSIIESNSSFKNYEKSRDGEDDS